MRVAEDKAFGHVNPGTYFVWQLGVRKVGHWHILLAVAVALSQLPVINLPQSIWLPECEIEHRPDASRPDHDQFISLLPASYRIELSDFATTRSQVTTSIAKEHDLERSTRVHGWLQIVNRSMPLRLVPYQLMVGREIVLTEPHKLASCPGTSRMLYHNVHNQSSKGRWFSSLFYDL